MPPVTASLSSKSHNELAYTYNDYAMVLGPLGRLQDVASPKLICPSPLTPGFVDPACLQQCQLIEAATRESSSYGLELACYHDTAYSTLVLRFTLPGATVGVGTSRESNLLRLLQELYGMLSPEMQPESASERVKHDITEPETLTRHSTAALEFDSGVVGPATGDSTRPSFLPTAYETLYGILRKTGPASVLSVELTRKILELHYFIIMECMCWAQGILTQVNLFW